MPKEVEGRCLQSKEAELWDERGKAGGGAPKRFSIAILLRWISAPVKTANAANDPAYFTTAYSRCPEELAAEFREAGFGDTQIFAVEGPGLSTALLREGWHDRRNGRA